MTWDSGVWTIEDLKIFKEIAKKNIRKWQNKNCQTSERNIKLEELSKELLSINMAIHKKE